MLQWLRRICWLTFVSHTCALSNVLTKHKWRGCRALCVGSRDQFLGLFPTNWMLNRVKVAFESLSGTVYLWLLFFNVNLIIFSKPYSCGTSHCLLLVISRCSLSRIVRWSLIKCKRPTIPSGNYDSMFWDLFLTLNRTSFVTPAMVHGEVASLAVVTVF